MIEQLPKSEIPAMRTVMLPRDTNAQGNIFGGAILSLMDQAAFVEAYRQAPMRYVTVAMDQAEFHSPVTVGDIVTVWADTIRIGRTSIRMTVRVTAMKRETGQTNEAASADITFVAIDEQGQPTPICR